jgi:uracil DNA glycosylase
VLDGVDPDVAGVDGSLDLAADEVIFPGRRARAPAGARADSHIFRALDGIGPDEVCVVILGQDPYQKVSQATGRSFEQGDLRNWLGKPRVAPSLQRIIQSLATARTGDKGYSEGTNGWRRLVDAIRDKTLQIKPPLELWDQWQSQGVLFINAIFTFTRAEPTTQFDGHGRLWVPIVRAILGHVVRRQDRSVVFVAWGDKANDAFEGSGAREAAEAAGTWGTRVRLVRRPHPNARPKRTEPQTDLPFLRGENAFVQINQALEDVGGAKVIW